MLRGSEGGPEGVDFEWWSKSMEMAAKCRDAKEAADLAAEFHWEQGVTPLMAAAERGKSECVKALLSFEGGKSCQERDESGQTALMWAARGGCAKCVEELMPWSDLEEVDRGGWTALIWASAEGRVEVVESLVSRMGLGGLMARDENGCSALTMAAMGGRLRCAEAISRKMSKGLSKKDWENEVGKAADAADQMGEHETRDFLLSRAELRSLNEWLPDWGWGQEGQAKRL